MNLFDNASVGKTMQVFIAAPVFKQEQRFYFVKEEKYESRSSDPGASRG